MTREQYVEICSLCQNRQMNFQKGLLCNLTNEKADFEGSCSSFVEDETVHQKPNANFLPEKEETIAGKKDMIYGAVWFFGGTFATLADFGFIFYGAILFGLSQFIKGFNKG